MCSSSLERTPKLQLAAEQPCTGECWISPKKKKKIQHVQGQRKSPRKMIGGEKSRLESKPTPTRDAQRAQKKKKKKACAHQNQEIPQRYVRPVFESPEEVWVSSDLPQGQGLWVQLPGSHSLWHKPTWRRSPLTPHRATE